MKKIAKKKIIVSVTNDLVTDNRVHKVCKSLVKFGYDVLLTGRKLPDSPEMEKRSYNIRRVKLQFNKGPLFYACYNIRLFLFLLFSKYDILLSNDLDTLPANYYAAKIRGKKLVFDSHEYFTEVPELINRQRVQKIWKAIEKRIVPHIKYAYTVCGSIADLFQQEYGTEFKVVRNIPEKQEAYSVPENKIIKTEKKIILYQGAINIGRGLPELIEAMLYIENALLVIVGSGDIIIEVQEQVQNLKLENKVVFTGRIPVSEVKYYTAQASLGLSIEKDMGLNYRFALPNKLFDYIGAQVPVMVSNLPEMAALVNQYQIGLIADSHIPKELAENLNKALFDDSLRQKWEINLKKASIDLTWDKEEKILEEIFSSVENS